jgi:DNA-binding XRE family transcriptional regulator
MTLPTTIRTERIRQGLTQKALAAMAGTTHTTISRLERECNTRKTTIEAVMRCLGIKAVYAPVGTAGTTQAQQRRKAGSGASVCEHTRRRVSSAKRIKGAGHE